MRTVTAALTADAERLLLSSTEDEWALIGPSVYETGRIVSDAPWLTGHGDRLRYLSDEQALDGGWGVAGFRLVPTLSATEALLVACQRQCTADAAVPRDRLAEAAGAGLRVLRAWLAGPTDPLPDLVAIELVVPRLVELINGHVSRLALAPTPYLPPDVRTTKLRPPSDSDPSLLHRLRQATAAGHPLPPKLWHSWEILTSGRPRDPLVQPVGGTVGCSPAATAAWLGVEPARDHPCGRYLATVQARGAGTLPVGAPMPFFERSWIMNLFAGAGLAHAVPDKALDSLEAALGPDGAPAGDGLPVDADDTASVLLALQVNGRGRRPDCLMQYFDGGLFHTYPEERTPSPTANAHAIDALGCRVEHCPHERARYQPVINSAVDWLINAQDLDGGWHDKWHGSRFYATATCVLALAAHGGTRSRPAIDRAVTWMLATRQAGGRWGHGTGTLEETAYAAMTLLHNRSTDRAAAVEEALAAAERTIHSGQITTKSTPLWIGKDVYLPVRIVQATCLAALHRLSVGRRHGLRR